MGRKGRHTVRLKTAPSARLCEEITVFVKNTTSPESAEALTEPVSLAATGKIRLGAVHELHRLTHVRLRSRREPWLLLGSGASSLRTLTFSILLALVHTLPSPCQHPMPEYYEPVDLTITPVQSIGTGVRLWVATYGSGSKEVRFEIRLNARDAPVGARQLSGVLQPHSPARDATEFLNSIVRAHRGPRGGVTVTPHDSLLFRAEVLGVHLSRASAAGMIAGNFDEEPPGTWTVMRLYIDLLNPEGFRGPLSPKPAEVFLALSPATGEGALVPVDSRWGPLIFSAFAGLVQPPPKE